MGTIGALFLLGGVIALLVPIKYPRWRTAIMLWVLGIVIINEAPKDGDIKAPASASSSSAPAAVARVAAQVPSSQREFITVVEAGRSAYRAGANDMQKGASRPARAKAICSALGSSRVVSDWVGQVYKLSSNGDGKGVLSIKIAPEVTVATWNNSMSDIGHQTLIESDSVLFRTASALSQGQWVKFSGTFRPSSVDCILESSITLAGSLTEPDFVFRFSDVTPLDQ